jgi:hypothetical protein
MTRPLRSALDNISRACDLQSFGTVTRFKGRRAGPATMIIQFTFYRSRVFSIFNHFDGCKEKKHEN